MQQRKIYWMGIIILLAAACTNNSQDALKTTVEAFPPEQKKAVEQLLENTNTEATFFVSNLKGNQQLTYNHERADEGFLPASTFKVMNSLIFLQEGVITDTTVIQWDSVDRDWDKWNQDLTIDEAFEYSAAWVYQKLARQLGKAPIQYWLTKSDYGNATMGGNADDFWLKGNLQITARQQVGFLKRLYKNELPFDTSVQGKVKTMMKMETGDHFTWYYKTGWGRDTNPDIVWNVGLVETKDDVYFYALNLDATKTEQGELRKTLPQKLLKELEILPASR